MANKDKTTVNQLNNLHLTEETLILYLDGEIEDREANRVAGHLKECWSCRRRVEKIESTIATFIDYRESIIFPSVEVPSTMQRNFDAKLMRIANECGRRSLLSYVAGAFAGLQRELVIRVAVATAFIAVFAGIFIWWDSTSIVSADELLNNSTTTHEHSLKAITHPVIYQKIRIKKSKPAERATLVDWELWHDSDNRRFKQSINNSNTEALGELIEVMRKNHMDVHSPLSAASYSQWRKNLSAKNERMDRLQLDNEEVFELHTIPEHADLNGVGEIVKASIFVRTKDHHPVKQQFQIKTESSNYSIELIEQGFKIIPLNDLDRKIFGELPTMANGTKSESVIVNNSGLSIDSGGILNPASSELEMEVIRLLSVTGADLGQEVSVLRTSDGKLSITGIVETENRKKEILTALKSVEGNPVIVFQIETAEEADKRIQNSESQKSDAGSPITLITDPPSNDIAIDSELRTRLQATGVKESELEAEINRYADRVLRKSNRALLHTWALRDLSKRFTPQMLRSMDPQARSKWVKLVSAHARNYEREVNELKQQLQLLIKLPINDDNVIPDIKDEEGIHHAVNQLVEYSSTIDRSVRAAFTISINSDASLLKSPSFREAVVNGHRLANKIRNIAE